MMEEVSIAVAYDAHIINQTTEEDLLASLVADSKLRAAQRPNQKQREAKRTAQSRRESQPPLDELIDRYQRENQLLEKASIRLEQENDVLAHELVTSKIALRNSLDQMEDKAELLNKELLEARLQLVETTEQKRTQEEEMAQLKEMFHIQLEQAESQRKTSSGIMAQYKQICSQLSSRLETEEARAEAELALFQGQVAACERCREVFDEAGQPRLPPAPGQQWDSNPNAETNALLSRQQELELELAQVKLQLVEAECSMQELEHQKGALMSEYQDTRNSWFSKALSSFRTATVHH